MSTGWSVDGPDTIVPPTLGWSPDGPSTPAPDPVHGWTPELWTPLTALGGEGTLTVDAYANTYGTLALDGEGTLSVDAYLKAYGTLALGGDGTLSVDAYAKTYVQGGQLGGDGTLSVDAILAVRGPTTSTFTTVGAWSLNLPWWANAIDLLGWAGGRGGKNGGFTAGKGGAAGGTFALTLVRGVDFPANATTISGVIGTGGATNGGVGGNTTALITGWAGATATGATADAAGQNGVAGPNLTSGGFAVSGGAAGTGNAVAGTQPGAGGSGGNAFNGNSGAGAPGQVSIRLRQS